MKHFLKFQLYSLAILSLILFFSCTKEDQIIKGSLEISFNKKLLSNQRVASDTAKSILISIEDKSGNKVVNRQKVQLFNFNGEYISEPIALEIGQYFLVEFLVLNNNDQVIYATPLEGSNLEYLIEKPLPISIEISQDVSTKIVPEVISVAQVSALDFGYSTFSFEIIETFDFLISVFHYDTITKNFELTEANLKIRNSNKILFDKQIGDSTNQIRIQDNYNSYELEISKSGFHTVEKIIDVDNLKAYLDSPLIITLLPETELLAGIIDSKIVILDPETGKATEMTPVLGLPTNLNWKSLTFNDDSFYFINNSASSPELYKISLDGVASKVGNFTYNGETIQLVESIAFNEASKKLIASASLDGGTDDNDFYTESIVEVDIMDGSCEYIASFDNGEIDPDQDATTFSGNVFYVFDGAPPGQNYLKFYESDFDAVSGNVLSSIYNSSYSDISDIAVLNNKLYYLKGRNLHSLDLSDYSSVLVGETHLLSEFNGEIIEGMTVMRK